MKMKLVHSKLAAVTAIPSTATKMGHTGENTGLKVGIVGYTVLNRMAELKDASEVAR